MNKIKRYSIHLLSFRFILFLGLGSFASCTYDYFEDETNYVVYAPKANMEIVTDEYRIEDIQIYIFNNETLQKQKASVHPFLDNARIKQGNFNFRVYPVPHSVYCFANTGEFQFIDMNSWHDAAFGLQESENGIYQYPASIATLSVETRNPNIVFPGPIITDTVHFDKRYSGKICFAFKGFGNINPLLTYNNIKKVRITATGVGTMQPMSLLTDSVNTRSSTHSETDQVMIECPIVQNPFANYDFGIESYFFPSLSDGRPISLKMDLIDQDDKSLLVFFTDVAETLHMNQTLYLGTDGMTIWVLEIGGPEEWDSGIETGGNHNGSEPGTGL